ncbi:SLIT and NTRK-like protein 1 [Tachysurus fulvidraco]|uniref:SLIT and NTRK-like protein 1 n=1 Tax=Tachysurus fulvidraco TaxID=1234273 RepID=UPI001FEF7A25|nr:SLIT and NTRK-like protein 1 [Tachysurus fulvidraco]XP_047658684.1 SLIT and NTRK-like protein 1 [Tachysurus fulvidraco]XP_047658685.1 SLIT and NTRK-like protein 1 [Tachysurus fulvidraco]XP_047658686.1 SLIT and NTRK-like protein 1 [Tachysurus fulvidraco]
MLLWIVLLKAALCAALGNGTSDVCKEEICSCSAIEGDLHIDCEKRGFSNLQHLTGPSSQFYHLLLHGNSLSKLFPNEFANFYNAVSLHLENNGLHDIVPGAFLGLQLVKRLHINNNKIRSFKKSTFLGLDDLEYLQADFNLLRDIDPAVFRDLSKLEVLILNDNLISALPTNIFQHVPITHLDLRGNRIKTLPYEGVLEQIPGIVEVLLEDNPWDCNCDLLSLKQWLENIPQRALVGRVVCEAPTRLQGNELNETAESELCPSKDGADSSLAAPPTQDESSELDSPPSPMSTTSKMAVVTEKNAQNNKSRPKARENWQLKTPTAIASGVSDVTCPQTCVCKLIGTSQGLGVNCEGKKLESMLNLRPKPLGAHELNLRDNNIHAVKRNQIRGYTNLNLLDLGGNNIKTIENGTFQNLSELRWLYMDKNYLDTVMPDMFVGLQNLEYLSLEYNDIQLIIAGAFSPMPNLRVLFLNNNLLKSLPADTFLGVSLSKISLHNNYFTHLPINGVLDQLSSIIQIDLHGNPWDCTCTIMPLKQWAEKMAPDVIVSDLKCESPEEFWKQDFRRIRTDLICPELYEQASPTSLSKNGTVSMDSDSGTRPGSYPEPSRVSISVLVPGLLLVFVTSAFTVVGMLVFVLRHRKRSKRRDGNSSASEINSLQTVCDSSYWHGAAYHADHRSYDCGAHSLSDK